MIEYSWVVTNGKACSRDSYHGVAKTEVEAVQKCYQSLILVESLGYWHEYFRINGETFNVKQLLERGGELGIEGVSLEV